MARRRNMELFVALASLAVACVSNGGDAADAGDGGLDAGDPDTDSDSESASDSGEPDASTVDLVPGWHLTWARTFGGGSMDIAHGSAAVGDDTIVTGTIEGVVTIGTGEPSETSLDGGYIQMYIARFAADGSLDWAKSTHPGINGVMTQGTACDATPDGVSVAAGTFWNYALFGQGEPNETALGTDDHDHLHCEHIYVAKYAPDGSLLWAREGRTLSWDEDPDGCPEGKDCQPFAWGAALLADGSALVSGRFTAKIVFGEGTPTEQALISAGEQDGFLAKYDADGGLAWANRIGDTGVDGCDKVSPASDGTFFTSGYFEGTIVLGEGEPTETTLTAAWYTSAFVARFDGGGALLWARDLGIDGDVNGRVGGLEISSDGNVIVTGRYRGGMRAGDGEDGGVVETPEGGRAMFVAKYTPDGVRLWNRVSITTETISTAWDLAELHDGSLVIAGVYSGDATFGVGEANETFLPYKDGNADDAYVSLCAADGTVEWVLGQGSTGTDEFQGVEALYDEATGAEWIVVAGYYANDAIFGTGGGDEIILPSIDNDSSTSDVVLLRFDRDEPGP